jgi:hypothetical protein
MKTMNKVLMLLLLVAATFGTTLCAQPQQAPQGPPQGNKEDRIEALRIAYISQQLNLTPPEAQKFWPVYNDYKENLKTLRQNFKPGAGGELTAEQQLDFEQKKLDLKKKFKPQFEGALGKDKVNQLYNLEKQFHDKLQQMREERRQQKGNQQGPGPGPGGPRGGGGRYGGKF